MHTLTIAGLGFEVAPRYTEGHPVTANEAGALNQTYYENLRNNFAKTVAKAKEEHGADLPPEVTESLRKTFSDFAESYVFGVRAQRSSEPVDPIMKIAVGIMKDKIKEAIKAKGGKVNQFSAEQINEKALAILQDETNATGQAVMQAARERHESEKSISGDLLSGLTGGLEEKQVEPTVDAEGAEVEAAPAKRGRPKKGA